MTNLVREGMRPLTRRFPEKYREWREYSKRIADRRHPLDESVTSERFREAVAEVLGLDEPTDAELVDALMRELSLGERQVRNILKDPHRHFSLKHLHKLGKSANRVFNGLVDEAHVADQLYEQTFETCYIGDRAEAQERLDRLSEAWDTLSVDRYRAEIDHCASAEFRLRALVEGFSKLSEEDRSTMLRVLSGLLRSHGKEARRLAGLIDGRQLPRGGGLLALANILDGGSEHSAHLIEWDQRNDEMESMQGPFIAEESEEWLLSILDEYVGVD